jgi:hypothetical protein
MPTYWKSQQIPAKKAKKATRIRCRKPKRSMWELFVAIWNEREHVCEVCGRVLRYDDPPAHCFPHRLSKNTFGRFRYCRPNIALTCPEHHLMIDAQRKHRTAEIVADCKKWLLDHPDDECE